MAGDYPVRHTIRRGAASDDAMPAHHGLRFSDVGYEVHPTLTSRAKDAEIDGHHQLAEQILSDVDFIGAAVLSCGETACSPIANTAAVPRPWLPTNPCLAEGVRCRQPRWSCSLDTAAERSRSKRFDTARPTSTHRRFGGTLGLAQPRDVWLIPQLAPVRCREQKGRDCAPKLAVQG